MKTLRGLATARAQGGFTMAELLVTSAVIALVMGGLMSLMMTGTQSWVVGANRTEAQQSARLVLFRLAEEVRTAGWDPRNTTTFPAIQPLAPPNIGFMLSNDWSADGAIQTNTLTLVNGANRGERVTYDFANNALRRQESQLDVSPVTVTTALSGITFTYLDADDVAVANPHLAANAPNIRTVEITVTAVPDSQIAATGGKVSVTSTIRARVRNR